MKGPHERVKYDLRRVWECPKCRHRERTSGLETACRCDCLTESRQKGGTFMQLVEDGIRRVHPALKPVTHPVASSSLSDSHSTAPVTTATNRIEPPSQPGPPSGETHPPAPLPQPPSEVSE